MKVLHSIADLRAALTPVRAGGITMVPTMGALHAGHLSLVTLADAPSVVVSIFVNPTQFAPHEDFDAYPRDLDSDVAKLAGTGRDIIVFAPSAREMYPEGFATTVTVGGPAAGLETDFRPHFFSGVATVVAKLLLAALPDSAIFGQKDYQQLLVVRRLTADLGLATRIIGAPIAREADGLAMSSRNAYLDVRERHVAGNLNRVLKDVMARARETGDLRDAEKYGADTLRHAGFDSVDYVAIRDAQTLEAVATMARPLRLLAAAKVGRTRLIDNMAL